MMIDPVTIFGPIIGSQHILTTLADTARYYQDWRGRVSGQGLAVLRPENPEQISQIVKACQQHRVAIVPQGGNTGLVGGSIPYADHPAIVLSLSRMNRLRALDPVGATMIVEAGCILQHALDYADAAGWELPIMMGSQGTSQIGGALSTNAGGILTIGYGNTREQVLGLEVVLADGTIWSDLNLLRKNNTGYDLKQLFIGAEGTLGIITAASLGLHPKPADFVTGMIGLDDAHEGLAILAGLRRISSGTLRAVELMSARSIEFALKHINGTSLAVSPGSRWYLLFEFGIGTDIVLAGFHDVLADALSGITSPDVQLAPGPQHRQKMWHLREAIVEAQKYEGGSIKHDISLPVSQIPDFIDRLEVLVTDMVPGARPVIFGHLGDGNLHANISQPVGADKEIFMAQWDCVTHAVHHLVVNMGGSFSAEHGIGRFKIKDMQDFKNPVGFDLMHRIKHALDPNNLFNPGKVLPCI